MLIRWRPRVFVSSSIRGFREERRDIQAAIDELALADAWLYEFASEASGTGAADQYLQAARDCDIFVLIVTDEVRSGTLDEYRAAVEDNPHKVLPFVIAPGSPSTAELREELRQRHHVLYVNSEDELATRIASSVRFHIETGEIVRPSLLHDLQRLRDGGRLGLGLPSDFAFSRLVLSPNGATTPIAALLDSGRKSVVIGPGGSGKTDSGLSGLMSINVLPIYARASPARTNFEDLVLDRFRGERFDPGPDRTRQYLLDGRVAAVIDGADDLTAIDRDRLYDSLETAARTYPRTPVLVLARAIPAGRLPTFERVELTRVQGPEIDRLFSLFGYEDRAAADLARLGDLAHLPFWAALVAQYGRQLESGVELLRSLVEARVERALPMDAVPRVGVTEALGALALAIRPLSEETVEQSLSVLEAWVRQNAARHGITSAAELLDHSRRSGLVSVEGSSVRFLHPLVASYLAATAAAKADVVDVRQDDPDTAAMQAALVDEVDPTRFVGVLEHAGLGVVAAYLRMTGPRVRVPSVDHDLRRFDHAVQALSDGIFGPPGDRCTTRLLLTGVKSQLVV